MRTMTSFFSDSIGYYLNCETEDGRARSVSLSSEPKFEVSGNVILMAIEEYLSTGETDVLSIPIDPSGTEFQKKVWDALRRIPRGEVRTYSQIAEDIGKPKAARAVGNAVGSNHLLILVPCHRVVARNGIGGFSTEGGTETKRKILSLERCNRFTKNRE